MSENHMDDDVVRSILGRIVKKIVACLDVDWAELEFEFTYFDESRMYTVTSIGADGTRLPVELDKDSLDAIIAKLSELRRATIDAGREWSGVMIRVNREGDFSLEFEYADED
jgi:hypothetical protein